MPRGLMWPDLGRSRPATTDPPKVPDATRGHNSPYWSPWRTGNLPEDRTYHFQVCMVRGDWEWCSPWRAVSS